MDTIYFKFNDAGAMIKCVQLMWGIEDLMKVHHTTFAMSSDGHGDNCFMSHAEDMEMSVRMFHSIIKAQGVSVDETTTRDPDIWNSIFARMVGIS